MKKKINKMLRIGLHSWLIVAVVFAMSGLYLVREAEAAALTDKSDVMSTLEASTASNHTISFTQDAGTQFVAGETITVQFDTAAQGFNLGSLAASDPLDYDIVVASQEETIVADGGSCDADVIEISEVNTTTDTITFTACSAYTAEAAGSTIVIEIGTNASSPSAGDSQITNSGVGTPIIAIGGTFGDTGNLLVAIIADDSVNVTATVGETLSFVISDVEIGFGALSATTGRWATADTLGADASEALPDVAHTMTIGTNAAGGYVITYNGALLTNGASDTIDGTTGISGDGDGTPGSEEFGISASDESTNANIAAGYARDATPDWDWETSTATTLVSESGPTADENISVSYLANIETLTEAGAYETDITYIATATY